MYLCLKYTVFFSLNNKFWYNKLFLKLLILSILLFMSEYIWNSNVHSIDLPLHKCLKIVKIIYFSLNLNIMQYTCTEKTININFVWKDQNKRIQLIYFAAHLMEVLINVLNYFSCKSIFLVAIQSFSEQNEKLFFKFSIQFSLESILKI